MGYQAVYLVENGYREDPYRFVNIDPDGEVCFEPWDGRKIRRHVARAAYLYRVDEDGDEIEILHYNNVPVEFLITDSRAVIRIPEYRDGDYEDDTRAAVLRSDRSQVPEDDRAMTLAGMIRYEWISQISYQRKVSRGTEECVRLYYRDLSEARWYLDIIFRGNADAEYLANVILHRACRYRLRMTDDKNDKETYFFNKYLEDYDIEPAHNPRRYMSYVRFPTQYPAPGGDDVRPRL
ncbi:MAG: hypothetical protein IJI10_10070 [Eubacterium sp.]|nr:hypothetical protein [Eubacterium sp.]